MAWYDRIVQVLSGNWQMLSGYLKLQTSLLLNARNRGWFLRGGKPTKLLKWFNSRKTGLLNKLNERGMVSGLPRPGKRFYICEDRSCPTAGRRGSCGKVRSGVCWADGFLDITLEGDSEMVIKAIRKYPTRTEWRIHHIVLEILDVCRHRQMQSWRGTHGYWGANKAVHHLVRWPPPSLAEVIISTVVTIFLIYPGCLLELIHHKVLLSCICVWRNKMRFWLNKEKQRVMVSSRETNNTSVVSQRAT